MNATPKKLLDQACTEYVERVCDASRLPCVAGQCKHDSIRTEQVYVS
jgi:hypothetical protein